jgi:hypothetical protein
VYLHLHDCPPIIDSLRVKVDRLQPEVHQLQDALRTYEESKNPQLAELFKEKVKELKEEKEKFQEETHN